MYAFIYFRIYWMTLSYPKRLINVHMYAFIYLYIYLCIYTFGGTFIQRLTLHSR